MGRRWGTTAGAGGLLVALLLTAGAARSAGRFPSSDPNPRVGTPNDPKFDCAEPDDEDAGTAPQCTSVFDEQANLFGFAPAGTRATATYHDVGRLGQGQVSGVSADRAWKTTIGSPSVPIAVADTGIRWDSQALRRKVRLNRRELPKPSGATAYDADRDGAFTVDDYIGDPRVADANGNGLLDGEDLIKAFSDRTDGDGNGFVDDIAGWDFFDDDNDPADASSYSSAHFHGTGRAEEAAQQTDDGQDEAGVCPLCQIMPLRVWDSFVVIGDQYGMATAYAADNGAKVEEVALGVFGNSKMEKAATRYAFEKGVALMEVSSDINSANHNYPTNYHETIYVNGCVTDNEGLASGFPGLSEYLAKYGIDSQAPVQTYFRNSNLTQYGGHAHVCMRGVTGSVSTGQAAGAAGLVVSRGLEQATSIGGPLTANEVKQLLTTTAEDVLPENTVGTGTPDPSQPGWDQHFGYGRVDLAAAVQRVATGRIPPEAWIETPSFWALLDPTRGDPVVRGHVGGRRSAPYSYDLQWAPGIEPAEPAFRTFASGAAPKSRQGRLGRIPMDEVADALPGAREGTPPADPNTYVFTVRLVVHDAEGNRGEDRKTYFAFHDPTAAPGWPRFVDTGGDSSPALYDLDGDGTLEVIEADDSGQVSVTRADGTPLPSFNHGRPWLLPPTYNGHLDEPAYRSGRVPPPTSGLRSPAVTDLDGDRSPDIVVTAVDGRLFVLNAAGKVRRRFPVTVDPALSAPSVRTFANHVKRGFFASPSVDDLDHDGTKEIIAPALDGHVYVWEPNGRLRRGFPVRLADPAAATFNGGEIISTAAVGDLEGDGREEIVVESGEIYGEGASVPNSPQDLEDAFRRFAENGFNGIFNASGRIYALHDDGSYVAGWPVEMSALLPDILPFVAPGCTAALADIDHDGNEEVLALVASGSLTALDGNGQEIRTYTTEGPVVGGHSGEVQHANLAEYPVVGDLDGDGTLEVAKGGATLNTALNLLLVGQNLPYDHLVQAWDTTSGRYLPGYPRPIDDFTVLSTPALADVGGAPGAEIVSGSGLYLVHAFGVNGLETAGFPKLTGGWDLPVVAVGDVDHDGKLDLVASTREGWRFRWRLDAPATAAALGQWPTEGHDTCHTNRYGADCS